ncbi:MAG: F0F1 ATP synthase subunit gamma [Gammaproteobacteria bacterium]|nr:F0F1 ATP synthase subunit gamma [Gammaproteobacteria bacterium]
MAAGKEIRAKIGSVKNTQKITKAMEMVAASKMRRAQERMQASRPYAQKIRNIIGHIAHATPEYRHPYMEVRKTVKAVGYIVVSSDKGLCGGLNVNVFKALIQDIKKWRDQDVNIQLSLVGRKANAFFRRVGGKVVSSVSDLGDAPRLEDVVGSVKVMLDAYKSGEIDRLFIVNSRFINTMTQRPEVMQLLPLASDNEEKELQYHWDYIYEPDAQTVLEGLLTRYIESQTYQGVVESVASEMAARMVAMKSASDNAGTLIKELQLMYNKQRQAAITQELSEIVAGAAAV